MADNPKRLPHTLTVVLLDPSAAASLRYSLECPYPDGHANKVDCGAVVECDCLNPDETEDGFYPDEDAFYEAQRAYEDKHPESGYEGADYCWAAHSLGGWLDSGEWHPTEPGVYQVWVSADDSLLADEPVLELSPREDGRG